MIESAPLWRGALYPGLGEQRRRPCLRLQQVGVTAFHPVPRNDAQATSLWPCPYDSCRSRPRLASGTSLCAVWTFLSENGAAVLPPGGSYFNCWNVEREAIGAGVAVPRTPRPGRWAAAKCRLSAPRCCRRRLCRPLSPGSQLGSAGPTSPSELILAIERQVLRIVSPCSGTKLPRAWNASTLTCRATSPATLVSAFAAGDSGSAITTG